MQLEKKTEMNFFRKITGCMAKETIFSTGQFFHFLLSFLQFGPPTPLSNQI